VVARGKGPFSVAAYIASERVRGWKKSGPARFVTAASRAYHGAILWLEARLVCRFMTAAGCGTRDGRKGGNRKDSQPARSFVLSFTRAT